MKKYLAFDIGGTHIKYGIVDDEGNVIRHAHMDTEAHLGGKSIIRKIISKANEVKLIEELEGIAISTAGQVNFNTGTIVAAGDTIPDYQGLEIKKCVSEAVNLPVEVRNDVDCAALCEKWKGSHSAKDFIVLTIGTGIGGGIVINNELYSGHSFSAGEWGYMLVEGEPFEKVASISGLIRLAKMYKENREWTGEEIFTLYDYGDSEIAKAVREFYKHLGIGIANLIYIFNPEVVIIGGGITGRGQRFLQEVEDEVEKYTHPSILKNTRLVLAKHSNQSGMIGAVYHFINRQNK
ncbi:ROK family protein [Caldifermentibacillus hisashii]|uniref:ROK family protein n=1 Tax=Caldifermentibacillus hisashii TaxID=996558 RepID=UPI0031B69B6A